MLVAEGGGGGEEGERVAGTAAMPVTLAAVGPAPVVVVISVRPEGEDPGVVWILGTAWPVGMTIG